MGHTKDLLRISACIGALLAASSVAQAQNAPSRSSKASERAESVVAESPVVAQTTTTPGESTTTTTTTDFAVSEPMVDETRYIFPNRPLLTTGTALFVLSYVPTLIYQGAKDRNDDLYIPVAGPWMDLAKGDDGRGAKTILAIDGALQGLGALGMVTSLFIPERRTRDWMLIGARRNRFDVTASRMTQRGYGLIASGAF